MTNVVCWNNTATQKIEVLTIGLMLFLGKKGGGEKNTWPSKFHVPLTVSNAEH